MVIDKIKAVHPEVPVIIYINKSGALLERMATSGVDIVSLDWTVTVPEARQRIGTRRDPTRIILHRYWKILILFLFLKLRTAQKLNLHYFQVVCPQTRTG